MKSILTSLFFFISINLCLSQTTWYISNSGSNTNSGLSTINAFKDINHALSVSNCGDSLYIISGTYHEKIQAIAICPENNRIVLQGDINSKPLIIGDSIPSSKYAISALGSGYYFRNIKLTSPYPTQCSQSNQVIVGIGDHFTFDDIIVYNSGYDGIKTYGDCNSNTFPENWKVINSEIYDCGLGCPASIVNGDGIDFTQCRNCVIENTIIRDNMGHQLQIKLEAKNVSVINSHFEGKHLFQLGLPGSVAQCDTNNFNADSVIFIGNTIIAKGDTSEFVFKLADIHNLKIYNNTIVKDSINSVNVGFICFGGCGGSSAWTNTPSGPIDIKSNIFVNLSNTSFTYGADTSFFDPFNIFSSEVSANYNLFYDIHNQIISPVDNGNNSLVAAPLFCDYPTSFELNSNSPCINSGDPSLPQDPDNSMNDIGAKYYKTPCTSDITNSIDNGNLIFVYPNPFKNELNVYSEINGWIIITNILGNEIQEYYLVKGQNKFLLPALQPKGIYILITKDSLGTVVKKQKLIKN